MTNPFEKKENIPFGRRNDLREGIMEDVSSNFDNVPMTKEPLPMRSPPTIAENRDEIGPNMSKAAPIEGGGRVTTSGTSYISNTIQSGSLEVGCKEEQRSGIYKKVRGKVVPPSGGFSFGGAAHGEKYYD